MSEYVLQLKNLKSQGMTVRNLYLWVVSGDCPKRFVRKPIAGSLSWVLVWGYRNRVTRVNQTESSAAAKRYWRDRCGRAVSLPTVQRADCTMFQRS